MKKMVSLIVALVLFTGFAANAQEKKEELNGAKIEFAQEVIDYGEVAYASNGEREFIIKNIGDAPLIITNTKGSCGCTVPTRPKEPIMPGKEAVMKVKYDTRRGGQPFSKTITVSSNAVNFPTKVVRIKGRVLPNPETKKKPTTPKVAAQKG